MANLGLSGLASGVDTAAIVDQLMAIERQGKTRMTLRQKGVDSQATILRDLKTKLDAVNAAAKDLRAPTSWAQTQTIESSDPTRVVVTRTGSAPIGGYSVRVSQLAAAAQTTFGWTTSASASQLTLDDAAPGIDPITIDIAAGASIADVAAAINGRADLPVYAAVVGGTKLVLSTRTTGAAADFSATGAQLTGPSATVAGRDAKYFLDDGIEHSSATNVVEDAIPGARLTFKGVTATAASITVGEPGVDRSKVVAKVKAFVDAYNALVSATRAKTGEKKVVDAATDADAIKGQMFGDTVLTGMLSKLRLSMGAAYTAVGNPQSLDDLADIGITTGAIGASHDLTKTGTLVVDETKLAAALESDAEGVRRLFGGGVTAGFAQGIEQMTKDFSSALGERITSVGVESKRITDELGRTDDRLNAKEKRLKAQFAAMESALSKAQTQQAWLTGQIAALS